MSEQARGPIPTEINLHRKSRLLNIRFSDGQSFSLPCEYLRVNSHAAEVTSRGTPELGKEQVNIDRIEPQPFLEFIDSPLDIALLVQAVSADVQADRVKLGDASGAEKFGMMQRFFGVVDDLGAAVVIDGVVGHTEGQRGGLWIGKRRLHALCQCVAVAICRTRECIREPAATDARPMAACVAAHIGH